MKSMRTESVIALNYRHKLPEHEANYRVNWGSPLVFMEHSQMGFLIWMGENCTRAVMQSEWTPGALLHLAHILQMPTFSR